MGSSILWLLQRNQIGDSKREKKLTRVSILDTGEKENKELEKE